MNELVDSEHEGLTHVSSGRANRLVNEKSPYLLQHAHNPVDWYPWSEEAFKKADAEDRPIFLSIGYSTCHWCHVMARESFEDPEVAAYINDRFVCIKVDREERPDVDHVYMSVCQMLTGGGGWPLSIVMTPDRRPFWAGTYLPKKSRFGLPGFLDVMGVLAEAWSNEKEALLEQAERVTAGLRASQEESPPLRPDEPSESIEEAAADTAVLAEKESAGTQAPLNRPAPPQPAARAAGRAAGTGAFEAILTKAFDRFHEAFDEDYGGFGGAPKFPSPHNLLFLLRYWRRSGNKKAFGMVDSTLRHAYAGGIYDHLGFGFFRYSTDARWMVPHFEKMLYDNAMMMMAFTDMAQATQKSSYREVVWEIASFLDTEMKSPGGAFYSAIDAESEGEEGKFYVWTPDEVVNVLGDDAHEFSRRYGISSKGNFEGKSILNLSSALARGDEDAALPPMPGSVEKSRKKLLAARSARVRPGTDDKVLTSWNGLLISALAKASRAFDDPDYLEMAENCLNFILDNLVVDGRLYARYREGDVSYPAYLDDYAFLTWALIEMHQTTLEPKYLARAEKFAREMVDQFWDARGKGFFLTSAGAEELIVRPKEAYDGAIPSGNSVAVMDLLRLSHLLEAEDLEELATDALEAMLPTLRMNPMGHAHLLSALDYFAGGAQDIRIRGSRQDSSAQAMCSYIRRIYLPNAEIQFDEGQVGADGEVRIMPERAELTICQRQTCGAPIRSVEELQIELMSAASGQMRGRTGVIQ